MDTGSLRRRVAVALQPRLFSDVVARVVARDDLEVVVVEGGGSGTARFDVAVISEGLPQGLITDAVIHLPDGRASGMGRLITSDGQRAVTFSDLAVLVGLIDALCPRL